MELRRSRVRGVQLAALGAAAAREQRLDRRKHGDVFRWFCRDTKRWWQINGIVVMAGDSC